MKKLRKRINNLFGGQKGFSLMETLIALAILGIIGVSFLTALSTGSMATATIDEQVQAGSLARAQLEDIKNSLYDTIVPPSYPVTVTEPPGYSVYVDVQFKDGYPTIKEITVTVSRDGKPVLTVTDFKVDR